MSSKTVKSHFCQKMSREIFETPPPHCVISVRDPSPKCHVIFKWPLTAYLRSKKILADQMQDYRDHN